MNKIVHVAQREFLSTVATKGFIIGVLLTPVLIGVAILAIGFMMDEEAPRVEGELAVIDPTGAVFEKLSSYLAPERIAERRDDFREAVEAETPDELKQLAESSGSAAATQQALEAVIGEVPLIHVTSIRPGADIEAEKQLLLAGPDEGGRLALAVVHPDAVERTPGEEAFGTYDLYVREKLDDRIEGEIKSGLRHSIVGARIRLRGLDGEEIAALTRVGRVRSTTVTEEGERKTNEVVNILLPAGFMVLLLVSVITSGQYIMTTTIEEKSSRVVEVLLSAVSPMQLMTGKIIGQMVVGLVILGLYAGLGVSGLVAFTLLGLVDLSLLFYLFIFFVISYFTVASMMASIGAAVNEMREAQTLMTPVMVVIMIPWLLWMPISRNPDSIFATVLSFIPPISNFVMLLRMTSTSPPPMWQVWLCIAIGAASVYAALWFAGKVFRIGLLMFGKPPNFATLIKWARMA
jgi:ABC-type Na+ efflux pump permease subunit